MKSFIEMELNFTSVFSKIYQQSALHLSVYGLTPMQSFKWFIFISCRFDASLGIAKKQSHITNTIQDYILGKCSLTLRINNWHTLSSSNVKISALWSGVLLIKHRSLNLYSKLLLLKPNVRKYGTPVQFHHHICIS